MSVIQILHIWLKSFLLWVEQPVPSKDHLEDNVVLQKQKQTHCRSYGDAVSVKSSFKEYGFDYD